MNQNDIKFTDLELSTITVQGKLSNIQFNLKETTEYIISYINDIIKIYNIDNNNINKLNVIDNIDDFNNFIKNIIINDFVLFDLIIHNININNNNINILISNYKQYEYQCLNFIKKQYNLLYTLLLKINEKNYNIYINELKLINNILIIHDNFLLNIINQLISINIFDINIIKQFVDLLKDIDFDLIKFNIYKLEYLYTINDENIDNNKFKQILLKENINYYKDISIDDIKYKPNELQMIDIINEKNIINIIYELILYYNDIISNFDIYIKDINNEYNNLNITNINIEKLKNDINIIINENNNKYEFLNKKIIKIGSNYGEFKSDYYNKLTQKPQKTNRGRKQKNKKKSNRKKQGNGKYFTSQITFTILSDNNFDNLNKLYHIKIFVNGVIQIPFVTNENINIILPYINLLKDYFNNNIKFIKINKNNDFKLEYLKSIMRNYKFKFINPINIKYILDLNKFESLIQQQKIIINKDITNQNIFPISEIKYNNESYQGITIKFNTHIQSYPNKPPKQKYATIKIFSSLKINIDGCKDKNDSIKIQKYIINLIYNNYINLLYIPTTLP